MRKLYAGLIVSLFIFIFASSAYADRSETAKVIKADTDYYDLIVERQNGQKWLLQHHRLCQTMSTEFPVTLITNGEAITELKVAVNERCKVYNATPYTGEGVITEMIKSENLIIPDHEAKLTWFGKEYLIDYDNQGCRYMRDFLDKRVYLYLPTNELIGSQLILPNNRGQCRINFAKVVGEAQSQNKETLDPLQGIDSQAQNNQVYFYWERSPQASDNTLYLISYSRNRINPDDYNYWEMPNLKQTKENSYTVKQLENGRDYYFYFSMLDYKEGVVAPWRELVVAPVSSGGFKNNPDSFTFEIELEETDTAFRLFWPVIENARRYIIQLYVGGKPTLFKVLKAEQTEFVIPKETGYLGERLRFVVRSVPKIRFSPTYRDGIQWLSK